MFRILDRYIGKTVLFSSFIVLLVLESLSAIIKFVEQLGKVGKGDYEIIDALWYVLLNVPKELELFFPVAALLGSLIGLGTLASNSELIIMQSVGLSRLNIANSVIKTSIPIMIIMMLLGEFVAPTTTMMAKQMRSNKISSGSVMASKQGIWIKDGKNFVNIGRVEDKFKISNVSIYFFNDNLTLKKLTKASIAIYKKDYWLLENIKITIFKDNLIVKKQLKKAKWNSFLSPEKLDVVSIKPLDLSISGLFSYIDYLENNKQDSSVYELALWRKFILPFTVCIMMLLSLAFVFGSLRHSSMGARLILGVVSGFSFYVVNEIGASFSLVYNVSPIIGAVMPSLIFLFMALILLKKAT